jgi:class 3 adenylate cyclase
VVWDDESVTAVQPVPPSGTVTFLFTDVVDSTRLWERDQLLMADALALHDEILRSTIEAHGGYVFSTAGDAFAVAFDDPAAGLEVAIAVRDALEEADWDERCRVSVRAGLHTGTAVERGGDYSGPTLNRCARVMSVGGGGDILLSAAIAELVDGVELVDLGMQALRGVADTMRVFGVPRRDGEVLRASAGRCGFGAPPVSVVDESADDEDCGGELECGVAVTVSAVG